MPEKVQSIARNISSNDWITITLLLVFLLLVFVKKYYGVRFSNFYRLPFSNTYFTNQKKSPIVFNFFSFSLFLGHALVIALGIFFLVQAFGITNPDRPFLLFIQIFLGYSVLLAVKYLIEKIIGNVFSIEDLLDNYIFHKITYRNFSALCLLPFIVLMAYLWEPSKDNFSILLVIFAVLNFSFLARYYFKNRKLLFSFWFYFILYLCTLEIAPYFILYKAITHANLILP